jgi:hypothetical protein
MQNPEADTILPAPAFTAPHSTLPARRPFFGRANDLEKVAKYLLPEDRSWGVVLDGPGGVGKTALALEAAHRAPAEHFPLKLWFTAKDRELLPHGVQPLRDHRVGRDDIPKAVPADRPQLVRHALANHRALLVLDNLEAFSAEERRHVIELLDNLPAACRAIITSRRRTDGSTAAHNLRLDKLERDNADELLAELGRRWEPEAEKLAREALRLVEKVGRRQLIASNCGRLAKALVQQGHGAEGLCHAQRAVTLYSELRSPDLSGAQTVLEECLNASKSVTQ